MRAVVLGAVVIVTVTVGLSRVLTAPAASGPTGAALSEGFTEILAASIGLLIGCSVASGLAKGRGALIAGVAAAVVAYFVLVVPVLLFTGPGDLSAPERVEMVAYWIFPWLTIAAVGAWVGAAIGKLRG